MATTCKRYGAILGIALAMFIGTDRLVSGEETRLPADMLAIVDGETVSGNEFHEYLETLRMDLSKMSLDERRGALNLCLIDVQLAREARDRGLHKTSGFRRMEKEFRREILPKKYFEQRFLSRAVVEEKDFEPYFADLTEYAHVGTIVVENRKEAERIRNSIGNAEEFDAQVKTFSQGLSKGNGGLVLYVTPGDIRFTAEEQDAIFGNSPGEILGPFANRLGSYTLIRRVGGKTVQDQKAEIRKKREDKIRYDKARVSYLARISEAMQDAKIHVNEEFFEKQDPEDGLAVLATINDETVEFRNLYPGGTPPHEFSNVRASLDHYLESMVASDIAVREGMAESPEYRVKEKVFRITRLSSLLLEKEYVSSRPRVSDKEIREEYRNWYKPEVYSLWVVINSDKSRVETARRGAQAGENLEVLAQRFSEDKSALKGGRIENLPITAFDSSSRKAVESLKTGEVSEVTELGGKFAVFKLLERTTVRVPKLGEVRDVISRKLAIRKRAEAITARRAGVLKRAHVQVDQEKLKEM